VVTKADRTETLTGAGSTARRRRVVVTGVAGFIGSHVAEALIDRGDAVVGIDALLGSYAAGDKTGSLHRLLQSPRFTLRRLDLRFDELRSALEGANAVVHEAALAGLPASWADVDAYVSCNVVGLSRLIEACQSMHVQRFVHASTSSVYGVKAVGDETQPTMPVSPYGVSKLAAEKLLLAHVHVRGFPATILRYFSIYGPRQRPDMAYHIFIDALRRAQPITVYGDGLQSRSNTYISDCVSGTLAAIDKAAVGEIYNIGGGVPLQLREAIDIIGAAMGVTPRIVHQDPRPGDQRATAADFSKARHTFGYTPSVDPVEGLAEQVRWQLGITSRAA
jgi:nucleoside-diphosphate-sugar epimerase